LIALRYADPIGAVVGGQNLELPRLLQVELDKVAEIVLVIDDENRFFGYGSFCFK
jgi:hypothetical protein